MDIELTEIWQFLFVVVLLVIESWATWRNPTKGGAVVISLLPTYIFRIRSSVYSTNILELLVAVFISTMIVRVIRKRERVTFPELSFLAPLLLLVFGATVSAARGISLAKGDLEMTRVILGSLKGFVLEPFFFAVFLIFAAINYGGWTTTVKAYVGSAVSVGVFSLLGGAASLGAIPYPNNPWSFLTYDGRLRGFYLSPNHLAMYVLPACVLAAAYSMGQMVNSRQSFFAIRYSLLVISLFVLFGTLLWTKSAGAILGIIAGLILYSVWHKICQNTRWLFAIRYLFFTIILVGLLLPPLAVQFSAAFIQPGEHSSFASRVMIWRAAEDIAKDNWLLGIGPGAFQYHYLAEQKDYPPYLEWAVPQPHNLFFATWLQSGILGLLGLLWLIANSVRSAGRGQIANNKLQIAQNNSPELYAIRYTLLAAMITIIVYGFVDTPFWKNDLSVLLLFFFGVFAGQEKLRSTGSGSVAQ